MDTLLTGAVGLASIAILNAIREITEKKNWQPLLWTVSSGLVAAALVFLSHVDTYTTQQLADAFVVGLGGSGLYTGATKAAERINTVDENPGL